jgi:Leucine-rich repeat (LRR) protein
MKSLYSLNLSYNRLLSLPHSMSKLEELTIILAVFNKIESLPKKFTDFKSLKSLYLSNNPINDHSKGKIKQQLPSTRITF